MHTNAYKGGGGGGLNMTKNTHFVRRFIENLERLERRVKYCESCFSCCLSLSHNHWHYFKRKISALSTLI